MNQLSSFLAVVCSLFVIGDVCADDLPAEVSTVLRQNAQRLAPLDISFERTRSSTLSNDELIKKLDWKPFMVGHLHPFQRRYAIQDDCQYSRRKFHAAEIELDRKTNEPRIVDGEPLRIDQAEIAFDGNVIYIGSVEQFSLENDFDPRYRKLPKAKAVHQDAQSEYFSAAMLQWSGYAIPSSAQELGGPVQSRVLRDSSQEGSQLIVNQQDDGQLVVEISHADGLTIYHLDRSKNWSVTMREERNSDGKTLSRATCTEYVELDERDVWLPQLVTVQWHTWESIPDVIDNVPILTESYRLLQLSNERIPEDLFTLDYRTPGTTVLDSVVPGSEKFIDGYVAYQVPANPDDLDEVVKAALEVNERERRKWWLRLGLVACSAAAIGCAWYVKRPKSV